MTISLGNQGRTLAARCTRDEHACVRTGPDPSCPTGRSVTRKRRCAPRGQRSTPSPSPASVPVCILANLLLRIVLIFLRLLTLLQDCFSTPNEYADTATAQGLKATGDLS